MEGPLDWSPNPGDFWGHEMLSEASHLMDLEIAVFDDANHFEQIFANECSPPSADDGKEAAQNYAKRRNTPPPPSQGTIDLVSTDPCQLSDSGGVLNFPNDLNEDISANTDVKPRCWDHGCNGREFSSKSNFVRHKKEKEGGATKVVCPLCGGVFTRNSARDTHLAKQSCNRIRRYSNGRPRPSKIAILSSLDLGQGTHH